MANNKKSVPKSPEIYTVYSSGDRADFDSLIEALIHITELVENGEDKDDITLTRGVELSFRVKTTVELKD